MDKRLYPVTLEFFRKEIKPVIDSCYSRAGRPKRISDYQVFCTALYLLRTGVAWQDLPRCYSHWHSVYLRFSKGSKRGVWWKILITLQQQKKLTLHVVLADSTTFPVHRHGGGPKGGNIAAAEIVPV